MMVREGRTYDFTDKIHYLTRPLRCFDTVFQGPYRYFSMPLKVFFPCPIAIKFSPVTGYGLKFVKMKFLVKSILLWQQ